MIDDGLREELSAVLDGALPEERAKELRRRITEEPELRREYAELERAVEAVRALPRTRAPEELRTRLRGSLGERRAPSRILRLSALAAAATVLLAVALALYLRRGPPSRYEAAENPPPLPHDALVLKNEQAEPRQAPAEEADRAQAMEEKAATSELGVKAEAPAGAEPQVGAAKDAAKRGARARDESDLLRAVVTSRGIAAADRKAYLRAVAALDAEEARAHVRAIFPEETDARGEQEFLPEARAGALPVLADILLEDREEASLVRRVLGTAPRADAAGAAALTVEEEAKDQIGTEVGGTPEDLRRLGRWLALLDLSPSTAQRPKVTFSGEVKREGKEPPKVRAATVRLRFGKPPEPPTETPPKEK
jgi:hypothetical protein